MLFFVVLSGGIGRRYRYKDDYTYVIEGIGCADAVAVDADNRRCGVLTA